MMDLQCLELKRTYCLGHRGTWMTLQVGYNRVQGGGKNDGLQLHLCATLPSNELHCTTCFASRNIYLCHSFQSSFCSRTS